MSSLHPRTIRLGGLTFSHLISIKHALRDYHEEKKILSSLEKFQGFRVYLPKPEEKLFSFMTLPWVKPYSLLHHYLYTVSCMY